MCRENARVVWLTRKPTPSWPALIGSLELLTGPVSTAPLFPLAESRHLSWFPSCTDRTPARSRRARLRARLPNAPREAKQNARSHLPGAGAFLGCDCESQLARRVVAMMHDPFNRHGKHRRQHRHNESDDIHQRTCNNQRQDNREDDSHRLCHDNSPSSSPRIHFDADAIPTLRAAATTARRIRAHYASP